MAVEKFLFLDESGVQSVSTYLLKAVNTRIKQRITGYVADGPAAASYTDDTHVLSAKAILSLIGNIGNYATITANDGTILGKIKALDAAIGTEADATANDGTVWGEIAQVRSEISGLTHLTYQVVQGPIATEVTEPASDVIYLQHDDDAPKVGLDGYLKTAQGANATANDGTGDYYGYYDATQNKYFKATESGGVFTVTETELASNDTIFSAAGTVTDNTYTLYVYSNNQWLAVGDTSLDLANYWSKTDADVNALKNLILDEITGATIEAKVQAAFNATDPFSGDSSYLDSWLS